MKSARVSGRLQKIILGGHIRHVAFKSVLVLNLAQTLESWENLGNVHGFYSNNYFLKYIKWEFITTS